MIEYAHTVHSKTRVTEHKRWVCKWFYINLGSTKYGKENLPFILLGAPMSIRFPQWSDGYFIYTMSSVAERLDKAVEEKFSE